MLPFLWFALSCLPLALIRTLVITLGHLIVQVNVPSQGKLSRSLNFICNLNFPLPHNLTYAHRSLGLGCLWGSLFCLPHVALFPHGRGCPGPLLKVGLVRCWPYSSLTHGLAFSWPLVNVCDQTPLAAFPGMWSESTPRDLNVLSLSADTALCSQSSPCDQFTKLHLGWKFHFGETWLSSAP